MVVLGCPAMTWPQHLGALTSSQAASGTVTWADAAQAVGTVLGAVLTSLAVVAALVANRQIRKIADREHTSAQQALLEQHTLLRDQARRDFVLNLLLKIHESAADANAWGAGLNGEPGRQRLRGLLKAVPEPELPVTRMCYGAGEPWQLERWQQNAYAAGNTDPLDLDKVMPEIGRLIGKVASSDTLTEWRPDN